MALTKSQKKINTEYFIKMAQITKLYCWVDMEWSIPIDKNNKYLLNKQQYIKFSEITLPKFVKKHCKLVDTN